MLQQFTQKEDQLLLHDGTEHEIPRPRRRCAKRKLQRQEEKAYRKKCCYHYRLLFDFKTFSGRRQDKTIADNCYTIPTGFSLVQDTRYQGFCPDGVRIIKPMKKPKGKN